MSDLVSKGGFPPFLLPLVTFEALHAVGLAQAATRASQHLSFGQRKRAALATVLSMRPEILVLDEPTSNLDPRARAFYNWLKASAQNYGFIFSYPYKSNADQSKNNLLEPYVTEYKAEPWHIRYVGVEMAQKIWSAQDSAGRNYLDPLSQLIPQQFLLP